MADVPHNFSTTNLLLESFARLSGSTQMRVLADALPVMSEADQILLLPQLAAVLQPHLLRPLLNAVNARMAAEGLA